MRSFGITNGKLSMSSSTPPYEGYEGFKPWNMPYMTNHNIYLGERPNIRVRCSRISPRLLMENASRIGVS